MDSAVSAAQMHDSTLSPLLIVVIFVTFRFAIGGVLLILTSSKARSAFADHGSLSSGSILGVIIFGGFLFQMIGLATPQVTPAVSAFLTSLYVLFTVIIGVFQGQNRLTPLLILGAILATIGAGWIQGPPHVSLGWAEMVTIAGAFLFGVHIIATDQLTKGKDGIALTGIMLLTVTLLSLILLIPLSIHEGQGLSPLFSLLINPDFLFPLMACGIFGSLVALVLLNIFQRHLSPTRAAILYALEPVWAAIASLVLGMENESQLLWLIFGAACLLAGNLLAEYSHINKQKTELIEQE